ncbi:uncharacterized protein LOC126896516 isoform X2 [Daktulosphaira vitifoliae]|uniref:uncharacterized protein LOC126896516 isoform X2 n=1 Tax=Daktulosphaira vitifoliae TaxID=58002 RepID=UPI0021AACB71|nr:uncharacterized protein LOC126896516 isoform X2 [Daktulosphaira vitifoliae]
MKKSYFILIIFIFTFFIESKNIQNLENYIFSSLIINDGWNNLKDVNCIQYLKNSYSLEQIIGKENVINCDKRIRLLTYFLACSYISDLKKLFFIFVQFGEHCQSLIRKRDPTGGICAIELFKIVKKIPSLATLMKETLYVLDYLHSYPIKNGKNNHFVLENVLLHLEDFNIRLQNYIYLENDTTSNMFLVFTIYFFSNREGDTEWECYKYCRFVSYDSKTLWLKWDKEYKHKINNDKTLPFYEYLSQKVNLLLNSIIINKFHKLGFQYDRNTLQIGIPLLEESINYDLKLYTKPNKTSATIQSESQREDIKNQFENQWILELIDSLNIDFKLYPRPNKSSETIERTSQKKRFGYCI